MIRVLVADDSPTCRGLLALILGAAPDIEVVGEAHDGGQAVRMATELRPDLVLMDLHMPVLDGLGATREIMSRTPVPIVIVTADARAVACSLRAVEAGALDLLPKPPGPKSAGYDAASRRLLNSIRAMAGVKVVRRWTPSHPGRSPQPPAVEGGSCRVVAVAASTGGPAALQCVLGSLPADFPAPILVVQHIVPDFNAGLVAWLDASCELRVKLAEPGETARPGVVYVAPADQHLATSPTSVLTLLTSPPIGGFRPSATALFASVAESFGPAAAAVILTGMGSDGVEGLRSVRSMGGRIIAQDESTCVVFGMPKAAIDAGLADVVLPLDMIAARILAIAGPCQSGRI